MLIIILNEFADVSNVNLEVNRGKKMKSCRIMSLLSGWIIFRNHNCGWKRA